jgi:hypothetical protein
LSLISISKKNEKHIEKNRIKPKMSTLGDFWIFFNGLCFNKHMQDYISDRITLRLFIC